MTVLVGAVVDVPPPWGEQLQAHRVRVGDPYAAEFPPHLTLLRPSRLAAERLDPLGAHVGRIAAATAPFRLDLDGTDSFRPDSDVVFVRVVGGAARACALAAALADFPGLVPESRFGYHPHVTVAHDVPAAAQDDVAAALADFTAQFPVADFTLFVRGAAGWEPYRTYRLAG